MLPTFSSACTALTSCPVPEFSTLRLHTLANFLAAFQPHYSVLLAIKRVCANCVEVHKALAINSASLALQTAKTTRRKTRFDNSMWKYLNNTWIWNRVYLICEFWTKRIKYAWEQNPFRLNVRKLAYFGNLDEMYCIEVIFLVILHTYRTFYAKLGQES